MYRNQKGVLRGIVLALVLLASCGAWGKTRYVEKWGDFANAADHGCSKSHPCLSIGAALGVANPNDRIIVGPGRYSQSGNFHLNTLGLKLESTSGRHATAIQSIDGTNAVLISQPRIALGKRHKGFTVSGATTVSNAGVWVDVAGDSPRIKIEGNRIGLPVKAIGESDSTSNHFGLVVTNGGEKIQIRYNIITNSNSRGLSCTACAGGIIRDNRIVNNQGNGATIGAGQISVQRNLFSRNRFDNVILFDQSAVRYRDNIAELATSVGSGLRAITGFRLGARIERSIFFDNANFGIDFDLGNPTNQPTTPSTLNKNLVVENDYIGVSLDMPAGSRVDGNIVVGNASKGFELLGEPVSSFKSNAAHDIGGCGVDAQTAPAQSAVKLFTANNSPDICNPSNLILQGTPAGKPPAPGTRAAAKVLGG